MAEINQTIVVYAYSPFWQIDFPMKTTQAVLITVFNGFILFLLFRMKKYTFSNLLFILLSFSDIILGCVDLPLSLVSIALSTWPLGDFMCVFYQIVATAQFPVSNYLLLVTTLHRYLQFVRPFDAQEKVTKGKVAIFAACWIGPYLYTTSYNLIFLYTNNYNLKGCGLYMPPLFVLLHDILFNMLPSIPTIVLNFYNIYRLYRKKKAVRFARRISKIEPSNSADASASLSQSGPIRRKSIVKAPNSNSKNQRDLKAAICLLAVVINTLVAEYFFLIVWPIFAYCYSCVGLDLFFWTLRVVFFFPIINPIILIIFHRGVQKELLKILQSFRICQSR